MVVQLLVILATAFLTVGLGGIPPNANLGVRAAFIGAAVVSFGLAAAWQSNRVRSRLPFGKTFPMRCHALWVEHAPLRAELKPIPATEEVPDDLYQRVVDWDRRVWDTVLGKIPERGNVLEVSHGGRLENEPRMSRYDLDHRMVAVAGILAHLISDER